MLGKVQSFGSGAERGTPVNGGMPIASTTDKIRTDDGMTIAKIMIVIVVLIGYIDFLQEFELISW